MIIKKPCLHIEQTGLFFMPLFISGDYTVFIPTGKGFSCPEYRNASSNPGLTNRNDTETEVCSGSQTTL
ncbi:MAG: hypothetical protein A2015_00915 [Spirochaetes bacterium GWF1_31_7]|nr:MAG: hypothetical protein A2Y30_12775 [Spirochaetes bacterium GWE1_32_154]OHD51680.1 MAG: hypothetical protein A2Y29_04575 [Spirochaetes bacterium GWE2_31_10]OHD51932.1 MAG: hypothetical protein A2015_00915 [Spirochaetes bacterium GWF1_31_7]HBD93017.1 hypothetical protein [Spirochaetia bacterium]